MSLNLHRPSDEVELAGIIANAAAANSTVEVVGGGSRRNVGRPVQATAIIKTENLRGVTLYEPNELVISARAGTPLRTVENELDKYNQQLAFEPTDLGPMLNGEAGKSTIGGVFATNASGSRRILAGAARDHLIGIRAVNGRGEVFKSGGRVLKNVTGYDLCRGLAGSYGTLGIFTEVTCKVLPKAEESRTLIIHGQPDEIAVEAMSGAMATPFEISGTIHIQTSLVGRLDSKIVQSASGSITALRIENMSTSVAYRAEQLKKRFSAYGEIVELQHEDSLAFWSEIRRLSFFLGSKDHVWRISTAPDNGPRVVRAISSYMECHAVYDWSGGLVWIEVPQTVDAGAAEIRRVIATIGGHATLIRAEPEVRAAVEVFQPLEAGPSRLTRRLKLAFDPNRVLNPGRMYADV